MKKTITAATVCALAALAGCTTMTPMERYAASPAGRFVAYVNDNAVRPSDSDIELVLNNPEKLSVALAQIDPRKLVLRYPLQLHDIKLPACERDPSSLDCAIPNIVREYSYLTRNIEQHTSNYRAAVGEALWLIGGESGRFSWESQALRDVNAYCDSHACNSEQRAQLTNYVSSTAVALAMMQGGAF